MPACPQLVQPTLVLAVLVAGLARAGTGASGSAETESGDAPPTPILSPARIRVPSPAWLRECDTLTGSIEATIELEGDSRPALRSEISGVVRLGEWSVDRGIINEITQPVEEGRFVLGGLPGGQRILRFFLGDGVG